MILEFPLKGEEIKEARALVSSNDKRFKPCLRLSNVHGQSYYLSWENLIKVLNSVEFDVDQKRVRKHLIPLVENKK